MRAAGLFTVFALGKAAALSTHTIPASWTSVAFIWQDLLVAFAFLALEWTGQRARIGPRAWTAFYWLLVLYAVVNLPVMMVLSTPLTWPMLRATSGTIADSILLYATPPTVVMVLCTMGAAAVLPFAFSRVSSSLRRAAVAAAVIATAAGPAAAARVDTIGLDRNVIVALVASALPRVDTQASAGDWTTPLFDAEDGDDLRWLRGAARGRNVVLVSLESTAAQYLPLYGAAENVTPRLDALAERGVVFDHAYAAYPESIKGLFSILCSTYPAFDTAVERHASAGCHSVASLLAGAGYRTGLFHSGRFAYLGMESVIHDRGYHVLEDAGDIGGRRESSFGVDEPSTVARMLHWIDGLPHGQPFFLTYLPIAGHHPYETPDRGPFADREEIGRYRNALHYADRSLGALVDGLEARGLSKNTVWVVIGDHGEAFNQHEGNYGHTFFLYDENVRVPFVIAGADVGQWPRRSRTIVSLVDTAPTILDLVGLAPPAIYQGRSALDPRPRMALFFTDYSLGLLGLRDGRWKFVHELESGRSKLFDAVGDPGEQMDVAAQHQPRVSAYARTLRSWVSAQRAVVSGTAR